MSHAVVQLPPEQIAPLARLYDEAVAARRRHTYIVAAVILVGIVLSCWGGEVRPAVFAANAHRLGLYFWNILPVLRWETLGADLAEWYWNLDGWLKLLFETVVIAYLGTVFGAIGAFCLCFLASANMMRNTLVRVSARRLLEFLRTVPEIVFALLFVVAFGLGAMPGVLALAIHTMGALGKLFAEVVENIDMKPVDGATAAGASWTQTVRFAVLPQVLSNFASYGLLRFEINVREAAIMGFVGAGGIGQDLVEAIRKFYYSDVSAILLLIIATVMIIDMVTERIRHALIGMDQSR
ncbi:phosphonate ABC transporter, permease protein PhnE [Aquabacter cavernae]|uniref:phosphonate ABC transporter, permease protein PhnE n=1 Tax=Aquabacter cavernae TaxID=2496029 RepID=UPI000F8DF09E|nr:phosphonate ABC transporter, permease protein PhnE [Aquabacter cavernae]